jgi:lipopolysaccharide export system protein LptA
VESSSLDVWRAQRRVSSGSQVLTSLLQPAPGAAAGSTASGAEREVRPVTIRADRLEYFDQGRQASYRGDVRLQTDNTTLQADRLDVYLTSAPSVESSELERAVAEGHVVVEQPTRRATGNHAEYFAAQGKILLSGGPPMLYDQDKGFTTGRRLTFFLRDDRLLVDGGDNSPTLSRHRIAQ